MELRVLMLGWEYPPHISGGLGTACEGLSSALSRQGVKLTFVVPYLHGDENAPHMRLSDSAGRAPAGTAAANGGPAVTTVTETRRAEGRGGIRTIRIPAALTPYLSPEQYEEFMRTGTRTLSRIRTQSRSGAERGFAHYSFDMFRAVNDYAHEVCELFCDEEFDCIHAHDWMTFPAAIALSQVTGKPFVAHIHSLEFDRSGEHINREIYSVEHWGFHAATKVVAVSYYTRTMIHQRYGVPLDKISVVHNGVYSPAVVNKYRRERGWPSRVVLFLGRVTFQKGPDYFVEAAARVIPHVPDVLFVLAGSGDMLQRMIDRVRQLGIESHFHFPGFLRGPDVEQMFSVADLYVMPSVSEPFGISALEAISYETPVVLSRQSGVAEVLRHVLKVDFWDVERMADLMINALLHEELRQDMVSMAREEVKRLRWDASALRVIDVYRSM